MSVNPTFVRYSTVNAFLSKEPALASVVVPADVTIPHRDGVTTLKVSQAVKDFTDALCAAGKDPAVKMSRQEVVSEALVHFKLAAVPRSETPAPTAPKPATPTPAAPDPAKAEVLVHDKAPMSQSLSILVLLTSAVALASDDNDPGAAERVSLLKQTLAKYRQLHGLS